VSQTHLSSAFRSCSKRVSFRGSQKLVGKPKRFKAFPSRPPMLHRISLVTQRPHHHAHPHHHVAFLDSLACAKRAARGLAATLCLLLLGLRLWGSLFVSSCLVSSHVHRRRMCRLAEEELRQRLDARPAISNPTSESWTPLWTAETVVLEAAMAEGRLRKPERQTSRPVRAAPVTVLWVLPRQWCNSRVSARCGRLRMVPWQSGRLNSSLGGHCGLPFWQRLLTGHRPELPRHPLRAPWAEATSTIGR